MIDPVEGSSDSSFLNRVRSALLGITQWVQGFIFGMTYYEMLRTLHKERAEREHLFVLISFGDLIGVPILPPYYSLRLLPFIVPQITMWKHRLLREKDLTDLVAE